MRHALPARALTRGAPAPGGRARPPRAKAWNIYSAPGALAALWVMERAGLRTSLLWGYGSQLACALMAYGACVVPWAPRAAFGLLYLSQARVRAASGRGAHDPGAHMAAVAPAARAH
jgi:hypothetical protein